MWVHLVTAHGGATGAILVAVVEPSEAASRLHGTTVPHGPHEHDGIVHTHESEAPDDATLELLENVVLTPHGYHGPSMAAPGYDLYYLNVMAGPAQDRTWMATEDPAHAWVRQTWAEQDVDPRLPMTRRVDEEAWA